MTPDINFESMFFNPFSTKECIVDNDHDPDVNFYHDVFMLDTQYLMPDKFKTNFKDFFKNSFSVLHLNIRSINKNFEAFAEIYSKLNHIFSVICFSETWASEENINKNSTFQLKNYNVIHQVRNSRKGGGLCIFINESLCCKLRKDLSINSEAIESLFIEICNKKASNLIFSAIYRPPTGDIKVFEQFCKDIFSRNQNMKHMMFAGDFNVNVLNYEYNGKVKSFFDLMYQRNLIPTINKPTRVGKNSATAIDHIITDYVLTCDFKTAILKVNLTDHFPIVIALKNYGPSQQHSNTKHKYKRSYNEENIKAFNQRLLSVTWDEVKNCDDPNEAYKQFFNIFNSTYDIYFPKVFVRLKTKHIQSPWITKGIVKSSKRKQKLYEKFLKHRTRATELAYKSYKNLFESLKKKAKKKYYSEKISKYKHDSKKTWSIMKELIGKIKFKSSNLPRRITVNEVDIFDKRKIANEFNSFFTNIGSKLAIKIPNASTTFESYINKPDSIMKIKQLSMNELKDAFFSLKINKSLGYDDISFNVVKKCFSSLCEPLKYLFNLSIEKGILPDDLKIAKVTPIYKADDKSDLSNYRPISVLSCFSKILERIMYNRLYQYLTEYTLGVFIDLSKAFDTVDHSVLLKKLELYGITDRNHSWFKNYLSNRKQFIQINNEQNTKLEIITCGVPQGSILGPLLFLLYVNDLRNASNLLEPIMYADDTNLFLTHKECSIRKNQSVVYFK